MLYDIWIEIEDLVILSRLAEWLGDDLVNWQQVSQRLVTETGRTMWYFTAGRSAGPLHKTLIEDTT